MEPHSSTGQGVTSDLLQLKYFSLYDWKKIDHVMFTVFYSWKSREIEKKKLYLTVIFTLTWEEGV